MAHVGQEPRLGLARLAQLLGPGVQLGVERDDAAVGVLQLLVEPGELLLPRLQLVQAADQLAVLLAEDAQRIDGPLAHEPGNNLAQVLAAQARPPTRQSLLDLDRGAAGAGFGPEAVHEALGAQEADTHAVLRAVPAFQHGVEVADAGPFVRNAGH